MEGTRERGRPRKVWRNEGEEDLNVMEKSKQAGSEMPERMKEDRTGSQGLDRTVLLEYVEKDDSSNSNNDDDDDNNNNNNNNVQKETKQHHM